MDNSDKNGDENRCESCGVEAETRYVKIKDNVGLVLFRLTNSAEGFYCKHCISYYFWNLTGKTILLGWWGIKSFIVTPFILINNCYYFFSTISMEEPPYRQAPKPSLFWSFFTGFGFLIIGFLIFAMIFGQ